ncbi:hypothetical protein Sango_2055800 [Sesamum angolense]|uniref:Reverse transcriptase domain-containing protein n=1 Tax=Sesamum angolense TaxID=2727404 RepID=A0AAE2BPF3_9LAMI|nr:hypothetical protein Sango_2055800 [Sesamum angolense]
METCTKYCSRISSVEGVGRMCSFSGLVGKETVEKIQIVKKCLKVAQDRQKSYVDKHHGEMEYEVSDKVFLKVSPWKGILRFGNDINLNHFIREPEVEISEELTYMEEPTEILDRNVRKLRNKEIPMESEIDSSLSKGGDLGG